MDAMSVHGVKNVSTVARLSATSKVLRNALSKIRNNPEYKKEVQHLVLKNILTALSKIERDDSSGFDVSVVHSGSQGRRTVDVYSGADPEVCYNELIRLLELPKANRCYVVARAHDRIEGVDLLRVEYHSGVHKLKRHVDVHKKVQEPSDVYNIDNLSVTVPANLYAYHRQVFKQVALLIGHLNEMGLDVVNTWDTPASFYNEPSVLGTLRQTQLPARPLPVIIDDIRGSYELKSRLAGTFTIDNQTHKFELNRFQKMGLNAIEKLEKAAPNKVSMEFDWHKNLGGFCRDRLQAVRSDMKTMGVTVCDIQRVDIDNVVRVLDTTTISKVGKNDINAFRRDSMPLIALAQAITDKGTAPPPTLRRSTRTKTRASVAL